MRSRRLLDPRNLMTWPLFDTVPEAMGRLRAITDEAPAEVAAVDRDVDEKADTSECDRAMLMASTSLSEKEDCVRSETLDKAEETDPRLIMMGASTGEGSLMAASLSSGCLTMLASVQSRRYCQIMRWEFGFRSLLTYCGDEPGPFPNIR